MTILYYFKPPQFIPAVERIYDYEILKTKPKKLRKRLRRIIERQKRQEILEVILRDEEDLLVLSLMLDGTL